MLHKWSVSKLLSEGGWALLATGTLPCLGTPGQNLTLIEAEEIERFCAEHARTSDLSLTRRNLVTRGVRLNDLVNVEFTIGTVKLRGVELCEPWVILGDALSSGSLPIAADQALGQTWRPSRRRTHRWGNRSWSAR